MADPSRGITIEVGDLKFNATTCNVSMNTVHDHTGMPMMGSLACSISATVDLNDKDNMPFAVLQQLFDLAHLVTRDKIRDIRISKWIDELQGGCRACIQLQGLGVELGDGFGRRGESSAQPQLSAGT